MSKNKAYICEQKTYKTIHLWTISHLTLGEYVKQKEQMTGWDGSPVKPCVYPQIWLTLNKKNFISVTPLITVGNMIENVSFNGTVRENIKEISNKKVLLSHCYALYLLSIRCLWFLKCDNK